MSCDHVRRYAGLVDPLGLCSCGGGGTRVGGHLRVGGGSCQMSCLTPVWRGRGELHVWAACVAIATKATEHQGLTCNSTS